MKVQIGHQYTNEYQFIGILTSILDDIKNTRQFAMLDEDRIEKLRIAMFDRGPGTAWLQQNGLIENGIPYQTMTGDHENNIAMRM